MVPAACSGVNVPGGAAVEVLGWVQERVEQRGRVVGAVLVGPGDLVVEHRVAEAVDGGGELGGDRRR